jgi:hypothetical protein
MIRLNFLIFLILISGHVANAQQEQVKNSLTKNEIQWIQKTLDNLYILMNGVSFSSTSALIANIKNTTKAVFIGEESGGTYEGPTGGQTVPIILPNSKIMVRISPNINIG